MNENLQMPQYAVTVDDVYGKGWWEKHGEEVRRKWKTEFRYANDGEQSVGATTLMSCTGRGLSTCPLLVILGPARPTLREVYGRDQVTIPAGWEWTGEIKTPRKGEPYIGFSGTLYEGDRANNDKTEPRLILRRTEPVVWYRAEANRRRVRRGDWYCATYSGVDQEWLQWNLNSESATSCICAQRIEELTPAYTLTEEMVEKGILR